MYFLGCSWNGGLLPLAFRKDNLRKHYIIVQHFRGEGKITGSHLDLCFLEQSSEESSIWQTCPLLLVTLEYVVDDEHWQVGLVCEAPIDM